MEQRDADQDDEDAADEDPAEKRLTEGSEGSKRE